MIHDSFMSSPTSIVVNGGKMGFAMELILTPIIHKMIEEKKQQDNKINQFTNININKKLINNAYL